MRFAVSKDREIWDDEIDGLLAEPEPVKQKKESTHTYACQVKLTAEALAIGITDLTKLKGVGKKIANRIALALGGWNEKVSFSSAQNQALNTIAENVWELMNVTGIGFNKCREIAMSHYGIEANDETLNLYGNLDCVEKDGRLGLKQYYEARAERKLYCEALQFKGVIVDGPAVWHPIEVEAERFLSQWLNNQQQNKPRNVLSLQSLNRLESKKGVNLNLTDEQKKAVVDIFNNRVVTFTGDAGTGKTHTLARVCWTYQQIFDEDCHIVAPSGKASLVARKALENSGLGIIMSESILEEDEQTGYKTEYFTDGVRSTTIHKALGLREAKVKIHSLKEITAGLVIIEEASMVSSYLLACILANIPSDCMVIMMGDSAQLPPVGWGYPFRTIIDNQLLTNINLTENHRQAGQEDLFQACSAVRVRSATIPTSNNESVRLNLGLVDGTEINDHIDNALAIIKANKYGLLDWQFICFSNKTRHDLNHSLQLKCNPMGEAIYTYQDKAASNRNALPVIAEVRVGDKVVITRNQYRDRRIYLSNGQTGIVEGSDGITCYAVKNEANEVLMSSLAEDDNRLTWFEGFDPNKKYSRVVARASRTIEGEDLIIEGGNYIIESQSGIEIAMDDGSIFRVSHENARDCIELGYAITCHKAQGSGWDMVVTYLDCRIFSHANEWNYTAISRAKKAFYLISSMGKLEWWLNAISHTREPDNSLLRRIRNTK